MNTGFPSYAGSPFVNRSDDYSPDSGFNSAYSSTFGSTGSRLGSSQDVEIHGGPKFGEFIHGKSPSWPVTQVLSRPSPGHAFPSSRSTSWPGQMKKENDMRFNASGVAGEKCCDGVSDATSPGDRTGNSWCDFVSRATHTEETLSPESARRIFREATVRNERVRSDRYSASFLNSTPEKSHKVFLRPSPSVVEKRYAVGSRASGHASLYGDGVGGRSTSSSLKESDDLSSCRRRITLPRENTSSYETLICPQSVPEPNSNEVDALSTGGAMGQFGLRSQMYHGASSQTDWQNNNTSHRVSCAPSDHQMQSSLNGKHSTTGSVCDFNHPGLSKLAAPVQLQRQWSDWNQLQVRSDDHSPGASPRGLGVTRSAETGHSNALSQSSQSPKKSPGLMISESLSTSHNDPDVSGDVESEKMSCSSTPVAQQIERLSLSRTSMLRKLSHEFYGQSAKHGPGLGNHAILRAKRYRRFGSVDETSDNHETLPFALPVGNGCQSDADLRSRFLKPCQNGNGVSSSGGAPECFTAVGVTATAASSHEGCYLPSVPETDIGPVVGQDFKSSYPSETRFQKLKPDERLQKMILPVSSDVRNITGVLPLDSPPPPDLPPRKYRESDDLRGNAISTKGQRLDLLGADDLNRFDSAADDYAEQLRRQAKRLSHSHSSIFTQIHSPKVEQVVPIGGHVRKPVDDADQESGSLQLSGCVVTSIHSPRVESGMSPNTSHCESVPNVWHAKAVPINSHDACGTVFTANGISESTDTGKVNERITTGKSDKTGCSKNLFGSDTKVIGKSSISDWINSIVEVKNSDKERWNVSYVRSVSSPENKCFESKANDSRKEEKKLSNEKNSSGEQNHLDHAGRKGSALEATSLYNGRTGSRGDREFSSNGTNGSGHEEKSSSRERNGSSQERKGGPQERKSVSQERKTLNSRENGPGGEKHSSDHGRKQLNQERGRANYQGNHSNAERKLLSPGRNSSSDERQRHDANKYIQYNQERSVSRERKAGGCERQCLIKKRKDLNHELHTATHGNDINETCHAEKCRSPEKKSLSDDSSVSHAAQRNKNGEKICKIVVNAGNDAETRTDCHKEETPIVRVTEAKLVISTGCCATAKPLNSIGKMIPAKKMKTGNPILPCDSDVGMTETTPVHSSPADKGVLREKQAEPAANNANVKPVNAICVNDSTIKASLLSSRRDAVSAKTQSDMNPNCTHFKEEIPSFLSDVLPIEHKTATYYLARLSSNNILSKNVECESCLPAVRASIEPYLRYLTAKAVASSSSSENLESSIVHSTLKHLPGKDELVLRKIDDKLKDFEREKQCIENEATENVTLGQKLNSLAEEKLESREFGKYKLYVDEMDKVLCLLLNVTKRLSGVETSIKSLPIDGPANERSALISKRDDLSQKYEDALALSEGIALRRPQVNEYLAKSLSDEEFKSFEHFVEAKLRLFLEKQTIEDVIAIVRTKLQSLDSNDKQALSYAQRQVKKHFLIPKTIKQEVNSHNYWSS